MDAVNKREILDAILQNEEELWIVIKPSRLNPCDPDELCVFQNPAQYKEASIEIPTRWFRDRELGMIESAVKDAIANASPGYKHG
ncbi:MAG TPA: hypothetical protein VNL14_11010 [Candidatus Acidoferrales bacterium]|nr:hypothetical protein [Candidatus Acidoferrales bacterium]